MLYYQQPPGPFLHRLSPTSQVLWPRLTSAGSAMPCDMGYIFRCVSHRPPRLRCNSLHPMQPLHLRDRVRVVWDFDLSCSLVRSATPSYAVSVRRLGTLPVRVDRFPLPSGFLQIPPRGGHPCLRLTLPTTKRVVDFHHQAIAHGGRTTESGEGKPLPRVLSLAGGAGFLRPSGTAGRVRTPNLTCGNGSGCRSASLLAGAASGPCTR